MAETSLSLPQMAKILIPRQSDNINAILGVFEWPHSACEKFPSNIFDKIF